MTGYRCGNGFAIGPKLAANAIRERQKDCTTDFEDFVAEFVILLIEQLFSLGNRRSVEHIDFPLPGTYALIWSTAIPASGQYHGFKELGLISVRHSGAPKV